ncbi:MAG: carbohydrate-binding family 9-like protein [Bacteroides sp.]|nr:carbohydrate-binding family 9-like protein [Bacteroides sp.]
MRNLLFFLTLLILSESTFSQKILFEAFPRTYVAYRTSQKLFLDGRLDEADWQAVPWTEDFTDIEGSLKPSPFLQTRVKMLWDENYFYIAAELEEPHLWATYTERESIIFHENNFEVFIDPKGDTHNYYELEINALGTVWDLMLLKPYRNGGQPISAWDVAGFKYGIELRGTLNDPTDRDTLWTVEMAFPWKVLKEAAPGKRPPRAGDQWRINFSRVQWQIEAVEGLYQKVIKTETGLPYPEYNWVWSPQGVIDMHRPESWGYVQFSALKAGEGKEAFNIHQDEYLKFVLRELYYRQHNFFWEHQRYARSLEELNPDDLEFFAPYPVAFDVAQTRFRLSLPSTDGTSYWHISEDSRLWKTNNPFEERGMFY